MPSPSFDERVPRPVHLIWGMMETKDAHAFIAPFKGLVERVYTVPIPDEANAFDADALGGDRRERRLRRHRRLSVPHALLQSKAALSRPGRVLICGSLYLAGHVLKLHGSKAGGDPARIVSADQTSASLPFRARLRQRPVWVAASCPSLKIISVGIARTL